jgi:hypothetical protein
VHEEVLALQANIMRLNASELQSSKPSYLLAPDIEKRELLGKRFSHY